MILREKQVMKRTVEQRRTRIGGEPVTTFVFKQNGEVRLKVSMPLCESLLAEIDDWLHGDGRGVARLCHRIEEPLSARLAGPSFITEPRITQTSAMRC
jgi:hypothetical protein